MRSEHLCGRHMAEISDVVLIYKWVSTLEAEIMKTEIMET